MDIVEYYKNYFVHDLKAIMDSSVHANSRISIVSLVENMSSPSHFGDAKIVFLKIENKPFFLFSYFYSVLLDQAIHSNNKILHYDFEKIAQYPKFSGILSSYSSNFHPANLLLIAINYIDDDVIYTKEFYKLTDFILNDYIHFFLDIFPKHTRYIQTNNEQIDTIKSIFNDIYNSMLEESAPVYLWDKKYDKYEYKSWLKYLRNNITTKIQELN